MKRMKQVLSVLLAAVMALTVCTVAFAADEPAYTPIGDGDLLHTEGEAIYNAAGEQVILRGTNFGGWGIMEDWFCPFEDPAGEEYCYLTLVERQLDHGDRLSKRGGRGHERDPSAHLVPQLPERR